MPILVREVPRVGNNHLNQAKDIMSNKIHSIRCVDTIHNIYEKCLKTPHHGFPVLNMQG